ncbi:hypothetical protein EV560_115138 [Bosea sp. BK604]|nr:hypothetical protein EV560_115138 [Bosea sp. BK604]
MKNAAIVVLSIAVVFLSYRLAAVENQRYAAVLNMCPDKVFGQNRACLSKIETRTSFFWHLYYGLRG